MQEYFLAETTADLPASAVVRFDIWKEYLSDRRQSQGHKSRHLEVLVNKCFVTHRIPKKNKETVNKTKNSVLSQNYTDLKQKRAFTYLRFTSGFIVDPSKVTLPSHHGNAVHMKFCRPARICPLGV